AFGGDYEHSGSPERARVSELAAEVQATEKAEHLADRDSFRLTQRPRERELSLLLENQRRPLAVAARWGEEKYASCHVALSVQDTGLPRVSSATRDGGPVQLRGILAQDHAGEGFGARPIDLTVPHHPGEGQSECAPRRRRAQPRDLLPPLIRPAIERVGAEQD